MTFIINNSEVEVASYNNWTQQNNSLDASNEF